jgi:hypothetical protein
MDLISLSIPRLVVPLQYPWFSHHSRFNVCAMQFWSSDSWKAFCLCTHQLRTFFTGNLCSYEPYCSNPKHLFSVQSSIDVFSFPSISSALIVFCVFNNCKHRPLVLNGSVISCRVCCCACYQSYSSNSGFRISICCYGRGCASSVP